MWLAIGLAAAGVLAIILEVFVPAAGIIGIAGLGSIIASVVIAYQRLGNMIGSIYLAVVLVLVPVFIVLYFRFFPRSPVGRWLISKDRQDASKGYSSFTAEKYTDLIGKEGSTLTILRPVGMVRIDGFGLIFSFIVLVVGFLSVLVSMTFLEREEAEKITKESRSI